MQIAKQYKRSAPLLRWSVCVCVFRLQVLAHSQLGLLLWRDTRQEADIKEWGGSDCEGTYGAKAGAKK